MVTIPGGSTYFVLKKKSMKIIFWGTPEMAVPTLAALHEADHQIQAVVTQPDRSQGRHHKELIPSPVKVYAQDHQIPVLQPESAKDLQFFAQLQQLAPEIMILVAYGQILPKRILDLAPYGFLNIHFALLPKHRGASPISSAILSGDTETGISVMKIVMKIDAGPVYGYGKLPIILTDTRGSLEEKLSQIAPPVLLEVIEKIAHGQITPQEQDHAQATFCKPLQKQDGLMDWKRPACFLERHIRAMSPWPISYTTLYRDRSNESKPSEAIPILIHQAQVVPPDPSIPITNTTPGQIVRVNDEGILVATGENFLLITQLQRAGKNVLLVKDFIRGTAIRPGSRFDV